MYPVTESQSWTVVTAGTQSLSLSCLAFKILPWLPQGGRKTFKYEGEIPSGEQLIYQTQLNLHEVMPFFEILILPTLFYFLPTNIMSLPQLLLPHSLLYYAIESSAAFPCPVHMRHTTDNVVLTRWWLPNPNRASLSRLPLKTITLREDKLWHWLGIFATRFCLHFAVYSSRVSTSPTEGSVLSQWDLKYTAWHSQWWERSSWSRKGSGGNSWCFQT